MAQDKNKEQGDPEVKIADAIGNVEGFIMRNGRALLIGLGIIVLIVGVFFGYKYLIAAPRADKAYAMMYVAEQRMAQDSFRLALDGDANYAGFLKVIDKYGATKAGNMAKRNAGVCYLHLGDYQKAIDYLKSYKGSADNIEAAIIMAQTYGMEGDANVQLGKYQEAVALYERAASTSANSLTTPIYLKKAGGVYEKLGQRDKALAAYESIEIDYPMSMEARDIQKYIGRLQQQ